MTYPKPRILLSAVFGIACLASALSPATAQEADGQAIPLVWDDEFSIAGGVDSSGYPEKAYEAFLPDVATLDGIAHVVWVDRRAHDPYGQWNSEIELRSSPDGGRTWGQLTNLSDSPDASEYAPVAASDGSSVLIAAPTALGQNSSFAEVRLWRVGDGGTEPFTIPTAMYPVTLAGDEGAYQLGGAQNGSPMFTRSTDSGRSWSEVVPLATSTEVAGCNESRTEVGVDAGLVAAAWLGGCGASGSPEIQVRVSNDTGTSWAPVRTLTDTLQREWSPAVAVQGDSIVVAWLTRRGETSNTLEVVRSTDAGATWSPPSVVDDFQLSTEWSGELMAPYLEFHDGNLMLFHPSGLKLYSSSDAGATWATISTIRVAQDQTLRAVHPVGGGYLAVSSVSTALNAYRSRSMQPPKAPTGLKADQVRRTAKVRLKWAEPPKSDVDVVAQYTVRVRPSGRKVVVDGRQESLLIGNLKYGVAYRFLVTASNAAGSSDATRSRTVTLKKGGG